MADHKVTLRLTPEQFRLLKEQATDEGRSASQQAKHYVLAGVAFTNNHTNRGRSA
jgi:hypothetical protein